jgi:hypothetical protein
MGRDFRAEGLGQRLRLRNIFRRFDAAADGDDERRLGQIDGRFCFLEEVERLGADLLGLHVNADSIDRSFAGGMRGYEVRAKRARLEGSEPGRGALKRYVGRGLALKHLAHENQLAAFVAIANAVANHAFAEHGGKLGREVANLVGVREEHQIGLSGVDDLRESCAVSIWRVRFQ